MLMLIVFILSLIASIAVFFTGNRAKLFSSMAASLFVILIAIYSILNFGSGYHGGFLTQYNFQFASSIGIGFSTGVNGFTDALLILSSIVILISVLISSQERYGTSFFGLILIIEAGLFGLLISRNFLFFYIFWEVVLIPVYFLIGRYGGSRCDSVSLKFFVYTHIGSVFILLSIFALYNFYYLSTGTFTFEMTPLLNTKFILGIPLFWKGFIIFGLLLGFLVKLPSFPVHSWLPDTYETAPYPGTVILAGALSIMGGYGLFGILLPVSGIFNTATLNVLIFLGIVSLLYFSFTAMFQKNLKRMMAYGSAAAMGFVTLSFSAGIMESSYSQIIELSGGMFQIIAHGLIMALVFSALYYIRDYSGKETTFALGGIFREAPMVSSFLLAGLLASLGLPGLAGFIGEFSIVVGVFQEISWVIFFVILGMIITASYHIWAAQKSLYGPYNETLGQIRDVGKREFAILLGTLVVIFVLGIYPNLIFGLLTGYLGGIL